MNRHSAFTAALAAAGLLALAGCTVAGTVVVTSVAQGVLVVLVAANIAVAVYATRRQRTKGDDVELGIQTAQAKIRAGARYTYHPDPPGTPTAGQLRYGWDRVDPLFPLGWRNGFLKGRLVSEMVPRDADRDATLAVYAAVITDSTPGTYYRTERAPDGRAVTVRYSHAPLPDGGGCVEATPLSPEIDVVIEERDALRLSAAAWQSRAEAAETQARMLTAEATVMRQQAFHERQLGIRPPAALAPASGPTPAR